MTSLYNCSMEELQSEISFSTTFGYYEVSRYCFFPDKQVKSTLIISNSNLPTSSGKLLPTQAKTPSYALLKRKWAVWFRRASSPVIGNDCVGQPAARALREACKGCSSKLSHSASPSAGKPAGISLSKRATKPARLLLVWVILLCCGDSTSEASITF